MPDFGSESNIVNDPYGPPHYYGATIWDVLRPRPGSDARTLKELYGAGYGGREITGIQPERSPLGKLLQGIGIIGEPTTQPLTDYEKMMYEEGRHKKGQEDFETEQQRMEALDRAFRVGKEATLAGGIVPSQKTLGGLPPEMYEDLGNLAVTSGEEDKYQRELHQLTLEEHQKRLQGLDYTMGEARRQVEEQKHFAYIRAGLNSPLNRARMKQIDALMEQAYSTPDMKDRKKLLDKAQSVHKQLQDQMRLFGATDAEIFMQLGDPPNPESALEGASEPRELDTAEKVHRMAESQGLLFNPQASTSSETGPSGLAGAMGRNLLSNPNLPSWMRWEK